MRQEDAKDVEKDNKKARMSWKDRSLQDISGRWLEWKGGASMLNFTFHRLRLW